MQGLETKPRRRVPEADAKRHAINLARPFLSRFEAWNHKAARATAMIMSHLTDAEEKAEQQRKIAELTVEVELAFREFKAVVADEPRHDRLDDVRAAFERLLAILRKHGG